MATYVLVHGSFHGGWCWQRVARRLRKAGHDVYTPTMTGLGERRHLVHPRVGLELHIRDIGSVLDYEDLEDVVLVGHSYGGLVITGVAEHHVSRIAALCYLDGYLPEDGQCAWDITPKSKAAWENRMTETDWLVPEPDPVERYGVTDPADAAWLREKMAPMPLFTHEEPLRLPTGHATDLPRAYISCVNYDSFRDVAEKAKEENLDYYELETGHDAMVTAPEELAAILNRLSSEPV